MKVVKKLGDLGKSKELAQVHKRLLKELGAIHAYNFYIASATLILHKAGLRGEKIVKYVNRTLKYNKDNLK